MNNTIYINERNIFDTWGLTPLTNTFFASIMKYPDAKDKVTTDFEDEEGILVLDQTTYLKEQEITLSFGVDSYANYLSFMDYLVSNPTFTLRCDLFRKGITYEYIAKSDFKHYRDGNTFAIKIRENNFSSRDYSYLVTDTGAKLITDNNNYIIL